MESENRVFYSLLMRLIAVRHGETLWNVEGRVSGQLDSPMTERGLQEVERLAARVREAAPTALYSSDLPRAAATAARITSACAVPIIYDARLREQNQGEHSGLSLAEVRIRRGDPLASLDRLNYVPPGGESIRDKASRVVDIMTQLATTHHGTVVVVTHLTILTMLLALVLRIPLERKIRARHRTGALSEFAFEQGQWHLVSWADASHCAGLDVPLSRASEPEE